MLKIYPLNFWLPPENEPSWLAKRHGLAESQPTVEGMATGLSTLARKAAGP